jgi:UDP-glucose 6-dehydrogenase
MKIAIIGYGNIGKHVHSRFSKFNPTIIDIDTDDAIRKATYDVAFLCLPTDSKNAGECDTSIVESCISESNANIIVIRSTVIPRIYKNCCIKIWQKNCLSARILGNNTAFKY